MTPTILLNSYTGPSACGHTHWNTGGARPVAMEPQGGWACAEGHALRWSAAQQTKSRTRAENTVLRKDGGMGVYASKTNNQTE